MAAPPPQPLAAAQRRVLRAIALHLCNHEGVATAATRIASNIVLARTEAIAGHSIVSTGNSVGLCVPTNRDVDTSSHRHAGPIQSAFTVQPRCDLPRL